MSEQVSDPIQIPLPLAYLGSVNAWLLQGEPLTLIDSGAANDETVQSLQSQLQDHGVAIEQIELVLLTHHHLDHSGLATMIKDRSGAQIAAHRATAQWGLAFDEHSRADQRFTRELMAANGVPAAVVDSSDDFFARIVADSRPFKTDRCSPTEIGSPPVAEHSASCSVQATAVPIRCSSMRTPTTPMSEIICSRT